MLQRGGTGDANNFDALRLAAALAVLVSHSAGLSDGLQAVPPLEALSGGQTNLGYVAVRVFFVISGYLIVRSFDRSPDALRFLGARALRVFPGLVFVLLLTAFVLGPVLTTLPLGEYLRHPETTRYVLGNLLLAWPQLDLPGVFEGNPWPRAVNGSLWTLYYEFLLYVAVLALGTLRLLRRGVVLALWAGFMVLSWRRLGANYVAFATPFLSGAVLYLWRDRIPLDWRVAAVSAAALGGALLTRGFWSAFPTFGAYLVIFAAFAPAVRLPTPFRGRDLSYGSYVFAFPVQQTVTCLLGPAVTPWLNVVLSVPAVLALAAVSWHFVEAPALSLKRLLAAAPNGRPRPVPN